MNKLKFLLVTLAITVTVLVIYSCSKDTNQNTFLINNELHCGIGLSENDISQIGTNHNLWLISVRNNIDFSAENLRLELSSKMMQLDNGLSENDKTNVINIYENCFDSGNNLSLVISNPNTLSLYNQIITQLELSSNIADLNRRLDSLTNIVSYSSSCLDKEALLVGIEVCKKSALLWFPREMGGMELIINVGARWDWKKFVRNDLAGATYAVFELGGAIALGAVPGTNAAIGAAIASAAVGGSLMGSLFP
jgi:hypothetical protein